MSIISIHQPNYLPWSGFFHKWLLADTFVILDNVQYHKNEWQNRNQIKTAQGKTWLTVPVTYRFPQRIEEVEIMPNHWAKKQMSSISQAYAKAPFFHDYWPGLQVILQNQQLRLVDLNCQIIRYLGQALGCTAPLHLASSLSLKHSEPTARLIEICQCFAADTYLSGAEGRNYLQTAAFSHANINLTFQHISPIIYPQLHGEFIPYLSVLDVLFNLGEDAQGVILNMGGMQP